MEAHFPMPLRSSSQRFPTLYVFRADPLLNICSLMVGWGVVVPSSGKSPPYFLAGGRKSKKIAYTPVLSLQELVARTCLGSRMRRSHFRTVQ